MPRRLDQEVTQSLNQGFVEVNLHPEPRWPTSPSGSHPEGHIYGIAAYSSVRQFLFEGTGGCLTEVRPWISTSPTPGPQDWGEASGRAQPIDPSEALSSIRAHLSLNVTQLSECLHVQRPTIYAWLRDEQNPQPSNFQRLGQLYAIARHWGSLSTKPLGRLLTAPTLDRRSIIELLKEDPIREFAIKQQLNELSISQDRPSPSEPPQRLDPALARQRLNLPKETLNSERQIDWLTGRRPGPE